MSVSLIIPTWNEVENIRFLFPRIPPVVTEIIVVDHHSSDQTAGVARSFGAKVIPSPARKGEALRIGLSQATKDIVVTMDGDGSQLPEEISRFVDGIHQGYDVVFGSRFIEGGKSEDLTPLRRAGNAFFRFLVNLFWRTHYSEVCYGFMAFKRQVVPKLLLKADGFDIEVEIKIKAAQQQLKILQIPSCEKKRKFGTGKLQTLADGWAILLRIVTEFLRST